MKLVIIGGTGLIGSKLVTQLREHGHEAVPASPDTGVNTLTGEGLEGVLRGACVVIDVSNSPSFEESAVMEFFTRSTRNLLKYAAAAGVKHYVALSVVGTERILDSPHLRAKNAPVNGTVEVAGPQQFRFDELIRQSLAARNDRREIVLDPHARYFGAELGERSLVPEGEARLGDIRFEDWLGQPAFQQR
jgi:uncharacterized protein YbjT (DUF2867 family)